MGSSAFMVETKFASGAVKYWAVVAQDEAHARIAARDADPAATSVTVGKQLGASEVKGMGLEGRPDGYIEPWAPAG